NGFDTDVAGGELTVRIDQPPTVLKFANATGRNSASENPKAVSPYESIPLDMLLADDVGVASADLEYRVNDGTVQREEIKLDGRGTIQAKAQHLLQLAGKVKEGDHINYRLRVIDNREVPEAGLKPH